MALWQTCQRRVGEPGEFEAVFLTLWLRDDKRMVEGME